ncbi:MAG: NAD(P)H-dependent oxidoreductase subunit E [Candidatus Rokubacteria bacterium]|nr:NAD(P)H-dependent oxidoreductase subunit E [Candidatus Rokubacteria bacterium]
MSLIAELNRLQARDGHLREEDLREAAERLRVPLYRIQEVVSFYPHFRTSPPPRAEVSLCRDLPCFLADGDSWGAKVRELLAGESDIEVREVSCLGRCDRAPAAMVNGVAVDAIAPDQVARLVRSPDTPASHEPPPGRRKWRIDPYGEGDEPFSVYQAWDQRDGEIIATLKAAGLRGMGGAGFQTGVKWELVRKETAGPKYVICNADESEPGTFKDRVLLEDLPHLVIEGMCLAAHVVGARHGWIYLRHEYDHTRAPLERAMKEARDRGLLGHGFDIEIFLSPGGYILGEETALLEALEDKRGEPRNRPPYPGSRGLWGKPTLINNVETLAMVPVILRHGAERWKAQGVRGHQGLKVMAVSGHVDRPGVYEIPMGTTVAELIEMAGGMRTGKRLKAFAPGGASSAFLPADKAGVEIDFASIQAAGSMLGSGALVAVADGADMLSVAANVTRFFRNESCGKCVPCRTGTEKVVEMLDQILAGKGDAQLWEVLPGLEETLAQTSICGLGQVALTPLTSVLKAWPEDLNR